MVTYDAILPDNAWYHHWYCIYHCIVSTIKGTSEQIKEDLIGAGSNTVNIYLYDGDNRYDSEYGNSSKAPVLTDDVKEEVRDLDHVENATFYYTAQVLPFITITTALKAEAFMGLM